jgi:hypothetical protein
MCCPFQSLASTNTPATMSPAFPSPPPSEPKNTSSTAPNKRASRNYFHSVGPTFSITPPATQLQLQFLDNSDPAKNTVVRKKAREWVYRNKCRELTGQKKKVGPKEKSDQIEMVWKMVRNPGLGRVDPFDVLPSVGRKVDHIIDYCKSIPGTYFIRAVHVLLCSSLDHTFGSRGEVMGDISKYFNLLPS